MARYDLEALKRQVATGDLPFPDFVFDLDDDPERYSPELGVMAGVDMDSPGGSSQFSAVSTAATSQQSSQRRLSFREMFCIEYNKWLMQFPKVPDNAVNANLKMIASLFPQRNLPKTLYSFRKTLARGEDKTKDYYIEYCCPEPKCGALLDANRCCSTLNCKRHDDPDHMLNNGYAMFSVRRQLEKRLKSELMLYL